MAACIVCNLQTMPDDSQGGGGEMFNLRCRLEKVLNEAVPEESVMCPSCQFDLAQIEMYYALLTVFKKRYADTAKLRFQAHKVEPSRNILKQTSECSSENFRNILGVDESVGGSSEMADLVQVKVEAPDPDDSTDDGDGDSDDNNYNDDSNGTDDYNDVSPKTVPEGRPSGKKRKPRKQVDPGYVPAGALEPSDKRKSGRGKKDGSKSSLMCAICSEVFDDRATLKAHRESHTEERPYVCSECGKSFKDNSALKEHMKIHSTHKAHICTECGKGFVSQKRLGRHKHSHSDSRPFACDQCEHAFKSGGQLQSHIRLVHVQGRKFLCSICGIGMYTESNLKVHMATHTKVKAFKCKTCGKEYATKYTLVEHELTHNEGGREKFLCPACGKEFASKYYMAAHMKQHAGESKHVCTICDKSFVLGTLYRRHMMIHEDLRPHQCTVCNKKFREIGNLKKHMMCHTDERPFKCSCGKAFRRKAKLQSHMQTQGHAEYDPTSDTAIIAGSAPLIAAAPPNFNNPVTTGSPPSLQLTPLQVPASGTISAPLPFGAPVPLQLGTPVSMAVQSPLGTPMSVAAPLPSGVPPTVAAPSSFGDPFHIHLSMPRTTAPGGPLAMAPVVPRSTPSSMGAYTAYVTPCTAQGGTLDYR